MNLYLISQTENEGYDTFDSAVVAAESEEIARNMNPSTGHAMNWEKEIYSWCYKAESVKVLLIGKARKDTPRGVICASFNAG